MVQLFSQVHHRRNRLPTLHPLYISTRVWAGSEPSAKDSWCWAQHLVPPKRYCHHEVVLYEMTDAQIKIGRKFLLWDRGEESSQPWFHYKAPGWLKAWFVPPGTKPTFLYVDHDVKRVLNALVLMDSLISSYIGFLGMALIEVENLNLKATYLSCSRSWHRSELRCSTHL